MLGNLFFFRGHSRQKLRGIYRGVGIRSLLEPMKKEKTTKQYYFLSKTHQEVVDQLNTDLPINIKYNEDLVNRVYERYPFIDKAEISLIIKATFQSFRDLLVLGKILNFNKLFFDTKLFIFDYRKNGRIFASLKTKISTPPTMLKNND